MRNVRWGDQDKSKLPRTGMFMLKLNCASFGRATAHEFECTIQLCTAAFRLQVSEHGLSVSNMCTHFKQTSAFAMPLRSKIAGTGCDSVPTVKTHATCSGWTPSVWQTDEQNWCYVVLQGSCGALQGSCGEPCIHPWKSTSPCHRKKPRIQRPLEEHPWSHLPLGKLVE